MNCTNTGHLLSDWFQTSFTSQHLIISSHQWIFFFSIINAVVTFLGCFIVLGSADGLKMAVSLPMIIYESMVPFLSQYTLSMLVLSCHNVYESTPWQLDCISKHSVFWYFLKISIFPSIPETKCRNSSMFNNVSIILSPVSFFWTLQIMIFGLSFPTLCWAKLIYIFQLMGCFFPCILIIKVNNNVTSINESWIINLNAL